MSSHSSIPSPYLKKSSFHNHFASKIHLSTITYPKFEFKNSWAIRNYLLHLLSPSPQTKNLLSTITLHHLILHWKTYLKSTLRYTHFSPSSLLLHHFKDTSLRCHFTSIVHLPTVISPRFVFRNQRKVKDSHSLYFSFTITSLQKPTC